VKLNSLIHLQSYTRIVKYNSRRIKFRPYLFADVDDLKEKLTQYININDCNFNIWLKGLGYKTPFFNDCDFNFLKNRHNLKNIFWVIAKLNYEY
jgi:hypothetical protein